MRISVYSHTNKVNTHIDLSDECYFYNSYLSRKVRSILFESYAPAYGYTLVSTELYIERNNMECALGECSEMLFLFYPRSAQYGPPLAPPVGEFPGAIRKRAFRRERIKGDLWMELKNEDFQVECTPVVKTYTYENSRGALRRHSPAERGAPKLLWARSRSGGRKAFPLKNIFIFMLLLIGF